MATTTRAREGALLLIEDFLSGWRDRFTYLNYGESAALMGIWSR
jgi:hypothetical protein